MKGILSVILLMSLFSMSFLGFQIYVAQGSEVHDVAVTHVTAWPTWALPVSNININVTVENQGTVNENFSLTIYAGNLTIQTVNIVGLLPNSSSTLRIEWPIILYRITIFPPPWPLDKPMVENVTIWAEASVDAGEVDTSDNVYIDGVVTIIWCPPDIDGDGDIDIFDIIYVAGRYGSESGDPGYDPFADLDQDGDIDIFDIVTITSPGVYGTHYV